MRSCVRGRYIMHTETRPRPLCPTTPFRHRPTSRTGITAHTSVSGQSLLDSLSTSDDGFEGLIASVWAQLAGVPFKLAGSGRQFGRDGEGSVASAAIMFEAKRYTSRLPSEALQAKLKVWHGGDER